MTAASVDTNGNPQALSKREIRELKSRSQRLDAHLKIGKAGVTDGFIRTLDEMLTLHELIKVKFVEFKDRKDELAPELALKTRSHLIFRVGHVAVYYRKKTADPSENAESRRKPDPVRPR
ncbi:MAG: YhbY family RNA-binding protein [Pedosphaera sp.]|nr:YhbY family RNA-binding protein [Pedosphaera sp.]